MFSEKTVMKYTVTTRHDNTPVDFEESTLVCLDQNEIDAIRSLDIGEEYRVYMVGAPDWYVKRVE